MRVFNEPPIAVRCTCRETSSSAVSWRRCRKYNTNNNNAATPNSRQSSAIIDIKTVYSSDAFLGRRAKLCHHLPRQHSRVWVTTRSFSPYAGHQRPWQMRQKPLTSSAKGIGITFNASMLTEVAREQMVEQQVRAWDVLDERILETLRAVPRERFVPERFRELSFADTEMPLPCGKRMLRPMLVGKILQSLSLNGGEQVLEIGTGSGYMSACLGRLGGPVRTLAPH